MNILIYLKIPVIDWRLSCLRCENRMLGLLVNFITVYVNVNVSVVPLLTTPYRQIVANVSNASKIFVEYLIVSRVVNARGQDLDGITIVI